MKKITSIVLALLMILSVMTVGVVNVSAEIVDSGECGEDVTYTLDDSGVLTISGTGEILSHDYQDKEEIREIIIEDGITSIGNSAFSYCTSLTSITIPDSVTSIGSSAFIGCESLSSITIPDSVTSIGNSAFMECSSLTSIVIPDGVISIDYQTFCRCNSLASVIIPDTVTSISRHGFSYCNSLTSITIPDSVTSIDELAFYKCGSLTSIIIPDSVTSIGDSAFEGCGSLSSITIPDSVTSIGRWLFDDGYSDHTDVYTSNQLIIDYFLTEGFHHSILGEYYVNYDEPNMIIQSGGSKDAIVTLDYDTANLRVTVPTVLPVSVDSDNNVTVSDSAQIVNYSKGQVDVTNAVLSSNNSWALAAFDTDFTKVPVDTKQYGFKLQGYSVPVSGNAFNNQFDTIAGNASLDLSYDANVAIQSDATTDAEIGNIVFTVAWHK